MTFFHTLAGAFFLPFRNVKLYLFLYSLVLVFFAGLLAWHAFGVVPLAAEIQWRLHSGVYIGAPLILKFILVGGFYVLAFFAIFGKLTVLTLYAASAAETGEDLSPGELLQRWRSRKEPLVTVYLAYLNYLLYFVILGGLGYLWWRLVAAGGLYIIAAVFVALFWLIFFLKFVAIFIAFSVGVAIALVDSRVSGTEAFEATRTVLTKKITAAGLSFFFFVLYFVLNALYGWALIAGYKYGLVLLGVLLGVVYLFVVSSFFIFVFNSVMVLYYLSVKDGEALLSPAAVA